MGQSLTAESDSSDVQCMVNTFVSAYEHIRKHNFSLGYSLYNSRKRSVCPLMAILLDKYKVSPDKLNSATLYIFRDKGILENETRTSMNLAFLILALLTREYAHQCYSGHEDPDVVFAVDVCKRLPGSFREKVQIDQEIDVSRHSQVFITGPVLSEFSHLKSKWDVQHYWQSHQSKVN